MTEVTHGAPKLALARIGVGAPKLALATYPSRLRLDVKASFDAPAIDTCVTSASKQCAYFGQQNIRVNGLVVYVKDTLEFGQFCSDIKFPGHE